MSLPSALMKYGSLPTLIIALSSAQASVRQDGIECLLGVDSAKNRFVLLPGVGNGTFGAPVFYPVDQVPVAILAALMVSLVGFTGIAFHLGRLIETRFEQVRDRPYLATVAGIALIVSPVLLARGVGLIPGLGILSAILVVAGVVLEYIAWTAGLGAAVLSRFGRPQPVPAAPPAPPPALATQ